MDNQLTFWDKAKFYTVVGVGFFADGWANNDIGLLTPLIGYVYFKENGDAIPTSQAGAIKGGVKIGMLLGQIIFGFLGDTLGRHKIYGRELFFAIFGLLMCTFTPWKGLNGDGLVAWLTVGRLITGLGLGGDYPMSAALALEKAEPNARARVVMWTFFSQALGYFSSGIAYLIALRAFQNSIEANVDYLDYVWRIVMGLPLIPCILMIYPRFAMQESVPYQKYVRHVDGNSEDVPAPRTFSDQMRDFRVYFWNWRHAASIFSASAVWFIFDICQNGIVLNQTLILKGIGYSKGHTIYQTLWNAGVGNIIVIIAGYLPGFILGNLALEWLPRRVQQAGSSLIIGVLYAVWAGVTDTAAIGGLLALFTVVQFLQNAGPNTTAFLLPIELFPTRVRGTSHGIVAAAGKLGAIITAFGFGNTQEAIGMKGVMGMFAGLSFFIVLLTGLVPETKGYSLEDVENDVIYKKKLLSIHGRDLETCPTGDWASTEESGSKGLTKTATVGFDDTKPRPL
ncbi:hypothetical protein V2G26_002621 [Clonostachys chloroleuca]